LLIGILTVAFLIILTGKILKPVYTSEAASRKTSKSSSSKGENVEAWYVRELSKRKAERPDATVKRNKEQERSLIGRLKAMDEERRGKEVAKRQEELKKLKKELERRKMPLVALDWDFAAGDKGGKRGSGSGSKGKRSGGTDKDDVGKKSPEGGGGREPGRLKKLLLGPLSGGPPRDTSLSAKKASSSGGAMALPREGGPGWKPADDAVAHAAIRGGAVRAESLANSLVKQKGS
jgi:hypothetical protein